MYTDVSQLKQYFEKVPLLVLENESIQPEFSSENTVFQTVFVSRGRVRLEGADGIDVHTDENLLIIPPIPDSRLEFSEDCDYFDLAFGPEFICSLCGEEWLYRLVRRYKPLKKNLEPEPVQVHSLSRVKMMKLHRFFLDIFEESRQRQAGWVDAVRIIFQGMMLLLARNLGEYQHNPVEQVLSHDGDTMMENLLTYLKDNLAEEFTLEDLAKKSGFSAGYFSRVFSEKTGIPLFEYINRLRVQKACVLLKHSESPVIDIAYRVGYKNLSYFNRTFKRIMELSPVEFRRK